MDTIITNYSDQMINNNDVALINPKRISLKELAQATEILKKYIYQQRMKTVGIPNGLNTNNIELAEQPTINSDSLQEEATLIYSAQLNNSMTENISESINTSVNSGMNVAKETIIATPVSTVIEPITESQEMNIELNSQNLVDENIDNENQINSESLQSFSEIPKTVESISSTMEQPVSLEPTASIISQNFPEAVEIPAIDDILSDLNPTSNSYVAQSNMAAVNTDYNIENQEILPVRMPDGQNIGESVDDSSIVTSPQSFGMM